MSDADATVSIAEEWYLYRPLGDPPQPYRSAPAAWPISADELKRTEAQAAASNPSALNNLGRLVGGVLSELWCMISDVFKCS